MISSKDDDWYPPGVNNRPEGYYSLDGVNDTAERVFQSFMRDALAKRGLTAEQMIAACRVSPERAVAEVLKKKFLENFPALADFVDQNAE